MNFLIPILLSVVVQTLEPEQQNGRTNGDVVLSEFHQSQTTSIFQYQDGILEHQISSSQNQNKNDEFEIDQQDNIEDIHSLQYWLEILGDDCEDEQVVSPENISHLVDTTVSKSQLSQSIFGVGISEIQLMIEDEDKNKNKKELQSNGLQKQIDILENEKQEGEVPHSRLQKYVQFQFEEEEIKQVKEQPQITVQRVEEDINPLKLLLLYSEDDKIITTNKQNQQIIETNEQILQELEKEKQEKIEKMQSLIIEQLKTKKPEKKKEPSFLEKDYVEWEMKTLSNNNNLRMR